MNTNAKWITSPVDFKDAACTFRKEVQVKSKIKKAILMVSAIGIYVPYINGERVGENVLAPGWTNYHSRVQYQTYDVTDILTENNTLEFSVGQGWAVGYIGFKSLHNVFADHTSLITELDISYSDGGSEIIITDTTWDVYSSEVTFSEIYHGETVNKTAPIEYIGKAILSEVGAKLIPQVGEFIMEHERLAPIELIHTPKGETVIDFGQNMTGYVEVKTKGKKGDRIVFHHAEVLDKDGNFYNDNYRGARNEITYILSGNDDTFKPQFSFQGFRYIKLIEYPFEKVELDSFCAIVVHSDIKRTGNFRCGNDKINQLYHNIIWGQKSNFLDIPTDCPQRDERLGWTGDAQVFCRTAAINYDVEKFFEKWLGDVRLEQTEEGAVYGIVPTCLGNRHTRISAAWGDAACIIPWQLYLAYGNKKILSENFEMMKKWVDYLHSTGPDEYLWLGGLHYGDWLAMDTGGDSLVGATANDLIASAFFAYSTSILIKAGEVLGKAMEDYKKLYINIVKRFREYFMENGIPKEELPHTEILTEEYNVPNDTTRKGITQTALVLILNFNLCTDEERPVLATKLVDLIEEFGDRMTTGFVGTPYIMHVLSENGYTDVAYKLLLQEKNPSWLYSVCHGATTMWEHWNSIKEDGSFWSTGMNSFNHYAYGSVYDWIFNVCAGISPTEENPAYKEIKLAPHPCKELGFVEASINSRNGKITSYWKFEGNSVHYEFNIPEGVTAYLTLPSGYTQELKSGKHTFKD